MARNKTEKDDNYNIEFYKSLTGADALNARLHNGLLPIMDIDGHPFFVDVRIGQVRPKDNFYSAGLDLAKGGYFDDKKGEYSFFYDKKTMEEARVPRNITELPKNVVMIKFPGPMALDPVAAARMTDQPLETVLKQFPLKMFRTAEVIPLKKTHLAEIVKANLATQPKRQKPNRVFVNNRPDRKRRR